MNIRLEPIEVAAAPERPRHDADDMGDLIDPLLKTAPVPTSVYAPDPSAIPEQRRPGRPDQVSPALIPLLRDPAQFVDDTDDTEPDALAPSRGMVVGLLLSVPIWACIGVGIWFIF